jgi:hypothetical protein
MLPTRPTYGSRRHGGMYQTARHSTYGAGHHAGDYHHGGQHTGAHHNQTGHAYHGHIIHLEPRSLAEALFGSLRQGGRTHGQPHVSYHPSHYHGHHYEPNQHGRMRQHHGGDYSHYGRTPYHEPRIAAEAMLGQRHSHDGHHSHHHGGPQAQVPPTGRGLRDVIPRSLTALFGAPPGPSDL